MTAFEHGEIRGALKAQGMTEDDLSWLDSFHWVDSAVPAVISEKDAASYVRREKALNASVAALLPMDRADRIEGRLAAAIGAQVANWKDKQDELDD